MVIITLGIRDEMKKFLELIQDAEAMMGLEEDPQFVMYVVLPALRENLRNYIKRKIQIYDKKP